MLGSLAEADDALQEAWLRVSRSGTEGVDNLGGWLTTVVARVCLNMLRSRKSRREEQLSVHLPDPIVSREDGLDPEHQALLADAVGLALQIVLDKLPPAERVAFVLHDMFALPFEEIAPIVDRSPEAARQLASRARRRVQGAQPAPDVDSNPNRQRELVDAFFSAARRGDFEALVSVLDPEAVLRHDAGAARPELSTVVRGATTIARRATMFAQPAAALLPALVNGAAGVIVSVGDQPIGVWAFTVQNDHIVEIDVLADPARLHQLDITAAFTR
jgi:RNA polymerase sigma-70 factor (ECF subfamily)